MSDAAPRLVNKGELARILKCSRPTVDALIAKYGNDLPVAEKGSKGQEWQFDPEAVLRFLRQQRELEERQQQERASFFEQFSLPIDEIAGDEAKGLTPSERVQLANARLKEQQLAREAGELLLASEMRMVLAKALGSLGRWHDSLPGQIARQFNLPDEVARGVKRMLDESRRVFARELRELLEREASAAPASEEKR